MSIVYEALTYKVIACVGLVFTNIVMSGQKSGGATTLGGEDERDGLRQTPFDAKDGGLESHVI